jgi:hypothetical protein
MATTADLEQQILGLPPADRARLILKAWESLADDTLTAADPAVDPESVEMARERDHELTVGAARVIDDAEFRRRTGAAG